MTQANTYKDIYIYIEREFTFYSVNFRKIIKKTSKKHYKKLSFLEIRYTILSESVYLHY